MKKVLLIAIFSSMGLALTAMKSTTPELSHRDIFNLPFEELLVYGNSFPKAPKLLMIVEKMHEVRVKCDEYTDLGNYLNNLLQKDPIEFDERNSNGSTVFHLLARLNNVSIFNELLKKASFLKKTGLLNSKNDNDQTPLHWAAMFGHDEMVKALLDANKKEPTERDKEGKTPLHLAAEGDRLEAAGLLLDKVRNPNTQDNQGKTPFDLACDSGAFDTAELLELYRGI